jgi:hypothetical protein
VPTTQRPDSVIFIFLDGVGLGSADPDINPLVDPELPFFSRIGNWALDSLTAFQDEFELIGLDANLEMHGLPQSGTGQATLFTGVNCAAIADRHFGPFPHSTSIPILREQSIFAQLGGDARNIDERLAFANAYPDRFFDLNSENGRWTVTTRCCVESGLRIRHTDEIAAGSAVAADMTGAGLRDIGIDVPVLSERAAADNILSIANSRRLTLFEYFLTDKAGHAQDRDVARRVLASLGRFLDGISKGLDQRRQLLIITSDHGNLEDLSIRVHTRNPVPLLALGCGASALCDLRSIEDVTPALVGLLSDGSSDTAGAIAAH